MNEDRAARYHRLKRRSIYASTIAGAAWLVWLLWSGASAWVAAHAFRLFGTLSAMPAHALGIVVVVFVTACGFEAVSLPFEFYRSFLLEREYGLSSELLGSWVADHLKGLGIGLLLTMAAGLTVYASMRFAGRAWWIVSALLFGAAAVGLSRMAPVLLMPLFYHFRPLERDALRERLLTLSKRAGVPVLGVFEWGLGEKTTRANAALVGIAATRRILVSDTLLKDYSDDEIEVILAHELAHHVHHDMWTGLALETVAIAASLSVADLVLRSIGPRFGVLRAADLAGLPLLALAAGAASLLLAPLTNAWSRLNERRADRFALTMTGRAAAFVTAMRRLGAQNLADDRPSRPVFWLFHTHPTIEQRVAAARAFSERA
ncbi:MAG: M48 family metalloprotease [Vicinamibacterales bacterium]